MSNSYATGEKRRRPAHVPSFSFFLTLPFVFNYVYICVMVGGDACAHECGAQGSPRFRSLLELELQPV